ncbi:MAG: methylmalonyl-CoA mutase family protein, partial [Ktedonobacterales bacterium]
RRAWDYITRIDDLGGSVRAVEQGYIQSEIEEAAYRYQRELEEGKRIVVGVNKYQQAATQHPALLKTNPEAGRQQAAKVAALRERRDNAAVGAALDALGAAARSSENLLPRIVAAVEVYATLGEISDTLRAVFGEQVAKRAM